MNFLIKLNEFKKPLIQKKNIISFIFIMILFFLDRISKLQIINNFNEATYYVNDYLNFDLIWNTGIGFGLLSSSSIIIYSIITFIIGLVIVILFYLMIISESFDKVIYSVIIGGAIGNFYDRLVFNAVPDFIDLHYNDFHWFTFNFADIVISSGILLFFAKNFWQKEKNI